MSDIVATRLYSAVATPMHADETIDFDALGMLIERDVERGVEGLYVGGSSGEGLLLTTQERDDVVRVAVDAAAARIPVISHIGSMSTRETVRLARAARDAGASALSITPPLYYRYSTAELCEHFRAVIEEVDAPFVLYNIPQFTGTDIADGGFEAVLELPQVIGVKHTSRNLYGAERILAHYPRLSLINGFDECYLPSLSIGARGTIGTTVGLQVTLFRSLRERFARGDVAGALLVQQRINDTIESLVAEGVFGASKYLTSRYVGTSLGACRRPLPQLDDAARARLDATWEELAESERCTAEEDRATASGASGAALDSR